MLRKSEANAQCFIPVLQSVLEFDGVNGRAEIPSKFILSGNRRFYHGGMGAPSYTNQTCPTILSRRGSTLDRFIFGVYSGTMIFFQSNGVNRK